MAPILKWAVAPLVAIACWSTAVEPAQAQFGIGISIGNGGYGGIGPGVSFGPSLGSGYSRYGAGYGGYGAGYGGYGVSSYSPGRLYGSSSYGYPGGRSSYYASPGHYHTGRAQVPVIVVPSHGYRSRYR